MPGWRASGLSSGRITSSSTAVTAPMASPRVIPATVRWLVSSIGRSWRISPSAPPAASNSSIRRSPFGFTADSSGTCGASSSNSA